jgi:hypothetical protein
MNPNNSSEVKSFAPYTGKAPLLVQIVGGLMWLGAAGLIIFGLLSLLVNPILGIIYLVAAVLFIMVARSLFKMRKDAVRNSVILAVVLLLMAGYLMISSPGGFSYTNLIYPIVLLVIVFAYKNRFVN